MAATVQIHEFNGTSGSESGTNKTSSTIRFKKADNATVDLNNPLVKPSSGQVDRSFEKYLRANVTVAPSGNISNPVAYMSGSAETGQTIFFKTTNPGSYATPAQASADTGYTSAFTYTSGSPKDMDAVNAGPFTGTGVKGDFLMAMMKIDDTIAAPGALPAKTLTYQWDET